MSGLIPDNIVEEINTRTDILSVVGEHVTLTKKGDRWWGLCPFHTEKTPSFSVNPGDNLWYCFGCHKGGGLYQFLMEIDGLSFPEAVRQLAEKQGIEIPESERGPLDDRRSALGELYKRVAGTFQWLLVHDPAAEQARRYVSERSIPDDVAENFGLGWAPADGEWLYRFLTGKNYSPEFLAASGLFSRRSPRWSLFVDRLMFPVMPDKERVVAFSGRALSDRGPKYINSPETALYRKGSQLYGMAQARKAMGREKYSILCEGNIDVLAFHAVGLTNAVAPLGTALTEGQVRLLKRRTERVVLAFDGDAAGQAATLKAAILGEKAGLTVEAAPLPPGKDPADLVTQDGVEALKKIAQWPINIFEYLLDFVIGAKGRDTGEAQEEALEELAPYLAAVSSDVRREAYIGRLAEAMGADSHSLLRDFRRRPGDGRERRKRSAEDPPISDDSSDELYLMTAVAVRTDLYPRLCESLDASYFNDGRAAALFRTLEDLYQNERIPKLEDVVSSIRDEGLRRLVLERSASGVFDENAEIVVDDGVRRLTKTALIGERREIEAAMTRAGDDSPEIMRELLARKIALDKEIDGI